MKIHKQLYQNNIFYLFLRNVTSEKSLYLRIKNDVTEKILMSKTKQKVMSLKDRHGFWLHIIRASSIGCPYARVVQRSNLRATNIKLALEKA